MEHDCRVIFQWCIPSKHPKTSPPFDLRIFGNGLLPPASHWHTGLQFDVAEAMEPAIPFRFTNKTPEIRLNLKEKTEKLKKIAVSNKTFKILVDSFNVQMLTLHILSYHKCFCWSKFRKHGFQIRKDEMSQKVGHVYYFCY